LPINTSVCKDIDEARNNVRNLRLYEVHKNGRSYWRLRTPSPEGRGFVERQFSALTEAQSAFELAYIQLLNHGVKAGNLSEIQRADASNAINLLGPFDVSLSEAAKFYIAHHVNLQASRSVADVAAELFKIKDRDKNLSHRYNLDLRQRLSRFVQTFGPRKIAELSSAEIDSWLRDLEVGPLSRNTYLARLNLLFSFACRRRWCVFNPITDIEKGRWKGADPGVLSPEQFARLLESASPETLPYWLIGGFCGLRAAELARLEWQDIDFEGGLVEVTRSKSKTAARRHVAIRPALAAWLAPYRQQATGKVCPANLRNRLEADRRRAGITDWPANGLRHSFASYHIEYFKRPGELTVEMGHVDEGLVSRFYRRRVRPEAAKAWWNIMPPEPGANIIEARFAS
jgi:integrase